MQLAPRNDVTGPVRPKPLQASCHRARVAISSWILGTPKPLQRKIGLGYMDLQYVVVGLITVCPPPRSPLLQAALDVTHLSKEHLRPYNEAVPQVPSNLSSRLGWRLASLRCLRDFSRVCVSKCGNPKMGSCPVLPSKHLKKKVSSQKRTKDNTVPYGAPALKAWDICGTPKVHWAICRRQPLEGPDISQEWRFTG